MGLETNIRSMLKEIGGQALSRYLSRKNEEEAEQIACECSGQAQFHSWREVVIISVFGRVRYKRRYYVCPKYHKGQMPRDEQMGIATGRSDSGIGKINGVGWGRSGL